LLAVCLLSCAPAVRVEKEQKLRISYEGRGLLELGYRIDDVVFDSPPKTDGLIMICSAQMDPAYVGRIRGVEYGITYEGFAHAITSIVTWDTNFVTPEGIRVGIPLSKVEQIVGQPATIEPGFLKYVCLGKSGWIAGAQFVKQHPDGDEYGNEVDVFISYDYYWDGCGRSIPKRLLKPPFAEPMPEESLEPSLKKE